MRATRSGIVIGLALALLVPGAAVGQEADEGLEVSVGLEVTDPTGDPVDLAAEQTGDAPQYVDLTGLSLEADDMFLWLTFEVAGDVPADIDPMSTVVGYSLNIDVDGDGEADEWVVVDSLDGWSASVVDGATGATKPAGVPVVADNTVVVNVPWPYLGDRDPLRYQGLVQAEHYPDPVNDPLTWMNWEDRVPDGEGDWLTLDYATAAIPGELPQAVGDLDALIAKPFPKTPLKAVGKDIRAYWDAHPEVPMAFDSEAIQGVKVEDILDGCVEGKRPGGSGCAVLFYIIVVDHRATHSAEAYDLARGLVDALMNNKVFQKDAGLNILKQSLRDAKKADVEQLLAAGE